MSTHEGRLFEPRTDLDRDTRLQVIGVLNQTLDDRSTALGGSAAGTVRMAAIESRIHESGATLEADD